MDEPNDNAQIDHADMNGKQYMHDAPPASNREI